MDYDIVIFWLVFFSCLTGLVMTWLRLRLTAPGWLILYAAILLVCITGWWWEQPAIVHAAAVMWLLLVVLPALIGRLYYRRLMQQKYAAAGRLARILRCLHPADGLRQLPTILHALELAQRGELTAASAMLGRFQEVKSSTGQGALLCLYRITNQWEELLAWQSRHQQELERQPQFLSILLRARGETGDMGGLVELYERHRRQIGQLVPAANRDMCRLMLFVFCGKRQAVERLFGGSLGVLPASIRAFWLATADLQAGDLESARRQLEALQAGADPMLQRAILRRLSRLSAPAGPLDASAERIVEEAAREHGHEETFGRQPSLFSRRARATQILIALNLFMFAVEECQGGGTNLGVLYRLGALFPPAVQAGQWWRLITSLFLHFGALHLAMNMFGLWFLGPFVEFALGFRRFTLVYLLAGIGSMAMVMALSSAADFDSLTVGASGCIMGLVGATGSLMLRGWLRERALAARRRLALMVFIVSMEVLFDSVVPHVSMTAHLSGAVIGFLATLLLQDRLRAPAPQPSGLKS